jgi:hypothetical protein
MCDLDYGYIAIRINKILERENESYENFKRLRSLFPIGSEFISSKLNKTKDNIANINQIKHHMTINKEKNNE